jgi:hypothetical protein
MSATKVRGSSGVPPSAPREVIVGGGSLLTPSISPKRSIVPVPIRSWLGSLRPSVQSVMPRGLLEIPSPSAAPPRPRSRALPLALAAVAALVFAGVGAQALRSHHHHRAEIVRNVGFGRAGLRKTPSGTSELWTQVSTTITIDPSITSLTLAGSEPIVQAFGTWASSVATLPQLSFDVSTTPGEAVRDGVNRIVYAPITIEGYEGALAITINYADDATGAIVEADTIFNSAFQWTSIAGGAANEACGDSYDLQNVATHEAGHFFGLGEDYEDKGTTMYVSSSVCQTSKRALSPQDVSVMSGLYAGGAQQAPAGCGGGASVAGGRAGGAPFVVLLAGLAGVWRRRRAKCVASTITL